MVAEPLITHMATCMMWLLRIKCPQKDGHNELAEVEETWYKSCPCLHWGQMGPLPHLSIPQNLRSWGLLLRAKICGYTRQRVTSLDPRHYSGVLQCLRLLPQLEGSLGTQPHPYSQPYSTPCLGFQRGGWDLG